ncbi:MAG: Fis family transcriptional regulator [Alphaproteobacteria bacterium]|nr:Fis family transcriptional regulator [Alphaproteobacteria bacterium]
MKPNISTNIGKVLDDFFIIQNDIFAVRDLYSTVISEVERALISKVLRKAGGNKSIATKMLGISRNTLNSKIKSLNIDSE